VHLGDPITSRSNARVKALRASFSGKPSQPGELLGIEGEHLIAEAVRSGLTLDTLFLRQGSEPVLDRRVLRNVQANSLVVLTRDVFDSAMETASPQGIAATLALPAIAPHLSPRLTLLLEDLQDPGNLGTLLRSAEAFGVHQILATPATVSHWNPRSSAPPPAPSSASPSSAPHSLTSAAGSRSTTSPPTQPSYSSSPARSPS